MKIMEQIESVCCERYELNVVLGEYKNTYYKIVMSEKRKKDFI